ncbi:MAG: hypothetical protein ACKO6N_04045 [Myxococcota bacterium]
MSCFISWLAPLPPYLRALGYHDELRGVQARGRVSARAWRSHLERSRTFILKMAECVPRARKVVILGSGPLNDVPLEALSACFERVVLVDVAHLGAACWQAACLPNVELVRHDLTGLADRLYRRVRHFQKTGEVFELPQPETQLLLEDPKVDLVVSLNLLSQLHICVGEYLDDLRGPDLKHLFSAGTLQAYRQEILRAHLRYLKRFEQARVSVIADVVRRAWRADGVLEYSESMLEELPLTLEGERWIWDIAPMGELDPHLRFEHEVVGVPDVHTIVERPSPSQKAHGMRPTPSTEALLSS